MGKEKVYDSSFYARMIDANGKPTSATSAEEIVPYLMEIFPQTASVVDVGCGIGTWLRQFEKNGVTDVLGLDGEWVKPEQMLLKHEQFKVANLELEYAPDRRFDMAISLEVAEHIAPFAAEKFIEQLVSLSDIILFSAAIPHQGGSCHVNEQWPSWWATKFHEHGFVPLDLVRPRFARNPRVSYFYSQNALIYVTKQKLEILLKCESCQTLGVAGGDICAEVLDYRHPLALPVRSSQSWAYIFGVLKLTLEAIGKKILHMFGIRTKTV